jgi:cytoskeletal protein CcmA (bactofilin family)
MLFSRKSSQERSGRAPEAAHEPARPTTQGMPQPSFAAGGAEGADGERSQSVIDASLTIVGDLHTPGDVRLDGRVCGNVSCAQLIVGRDAAIAGTVTAREAVIRGTVTGTIRAPVVILQEPARVESDVVYTVLAVDDGATFEGIARRSDRPLEKAEAPSALAELQQIVRAADPAGRANGQAANGHDTASASAATSATPATVPPERPEEEKAAAQPRPSAA